MNEITQKQIDMTLEEFKIYEVPVGWRMRHVTGHEKRGWPGSLDTYFSVCDIREEE